ncbi:MAG: carbon-nitrogen hydrolase family protein [Nocardioidaceae bacterium]|nr:carbon-nitrogen hydrolase family protein [Nocardioidaceae bacterium]
MHVALIQMSATTDSGQNREVVAAALSDLEPGLDLVVLPEASMHDFGAADHDLASAAEPLDGPYAQLLGAHAARLGATIVAGTFERVAGEDRPFNTLQVHGPDGGLAGTYRKCHLYDSFGYRESDRLLAGGTEPVVLDVAGRRLGLMTCYDLRFPEHARLLVDAGADVLVAPSAWVRGPLKEDHWETLVRSRAIENTVDVLAVGQCGGTYVGRTMAVDPLGVVVASAGEAPATVRATLSVERLEHARATNPSLRNRRLPGTGR